METIYKNNFLSLYHADCMELLKQTPDDYYSLALVDVPYGIGEDGSKNHTRSKLAISKDYKPYAGNDLKAPDIEYWNELKRISKPYVLSSNGLEALKLFEQNILDPGYKTISAQYRVRNSAFEIFFRYLNGNIVPVFSYKIIDGIGTNNPEAYVYELQDNPSQLQRDFLIYEAVIPNYSLEEALKNTNYYPYDDLEKQEPERLRFFFEKSMQKYATNDALPD
jgi:hypothetical protein